MAETITLTSKIISYRLTRWSKKELAIEVRFAVNHYESVMPLHYVALSGTIYCGAKQVHPIDILGINVEKYLQGEIELQYENMRFKVENDEFVRI